ncbi:MULTISPECIES: YceI family protein [Protofrankia]|uniref:YceI family protein n=1 Tax=Candidatus Protofrankia datiscae TaxID=2716812 RepID=F8B3F6_9ACTN|nr:MULTISPECIES: YceI family protein [Protofrankia]AEH09063.1 YceI family protein [Candidatus Protofrankia datiscae]
MTVPGTAIENLTGTWTIDPAHSRFGFAVRHAMVATVRGSFRSFEGTLHLDGFRPTASHATISINTDSIDTGNSDRDTHLRSPDFLDADTHPTITFTGTGIKPGDDPDSYVVTGDLTIHGTTHVVEVAVEFQGSAVDSFGNSRVGFAATSSLSRKDFGLTWNAPLEAGGVLIGDKVKIDVDISAIRAS